MVPPALNTISCTPLDHMLDGRYPWSRRIRFVDDKLRRVRLHVDDPLAPLILRGVPYRSLTSMWPGIVVVR